MQFIAHLSKFRAGYTVRGGLSIFHASHLIELSILRSTSRISVNILKAITKLNRPRKELIDGVNHHAFYKLNSIGS